MTRSEGVGIESQAWIFALRDHGYRLTDARKAVVNVVANSQRVLRPAEVFDFARQVYPRLGLVTVYRTMEKLEELGLIQRVHREQDCQAFVPTCSGHQHLLLCTQCGKYVYFEGADLTNLFAGVENDTGFTTQGHWMQIFGICPQCQAEMQEKPMGES
ncbi:MAG: transcriptional repressor [Anaerolineaceae bacterium]|nr:transcriptional repressor [Anaerolineaceae bacterium]